jgi:outer membrane protein TolC
MRASFTVLAALVLVFVARSRAIASEHEEDTYVIGETSTVAKPVKNTNERTLAELVEEALQNNRRIKIDAAKIGEARALLSIAKAQAYPSVMGTSVIGGPTPERKATTTDPQMFPTVSEASLRNNLQFGQLGFTFQMHAEGAVPLYTFGKISSAKDAASSVIRAAENKEAITEADVVLDVNRAFWGFQLARTYVGSLEDGERTLLKVQKKIEELLDAESPQVTENDRLRMIHALATLRVRLNEAQAGMRFASQAMKLLIGRDQASPLEIVGADLDELPPDIPDVEKLVKSARQARPELLAIRSVVDAASKYTEFRKNGLWPDIFLGGIIDYGYTSNATSQKNPFVYDPYNYFGIGLGLGMRFQLDVFNKLAEVEQAEAEVATHTAEEEAIEQAVEVEIRKIYTDLTSGYARIQLLERANRAARGWLTASTLAYDIGTGDARQLTESFLAWAASEAELQKTRFDMHLAHADYARAAGDLVHRKR